MIKKRSSKQGLKIGIAGDIFADSVFNFKKLKDLSHGFLLIILMLLAIGLTALSSATFPSNSLFVKQLISSPFMYAIFAMIVSLHPFFLRKYAYEVYFVCLFLLCLTLLFGKKAMGGQRWIGFGGFQVQPSEFIKIGIILFMAKYFSRSGMRDIFSIKKILKPILSFITACFLTIIQPDLGTGMIIIFVSTILLFISGVKLWKFFASGAIILISIPIIWNGLHDYQRNRVEIFLNSDRDILNTGYNINQAKIAIGSGGFFGNGVGNGTQTRLHFVPENKTDFIFTVIGEEGGFLGCLAVLMLYCGLIYYGVITANMANDFFLKTVAYGASALLFLHVSINIGMNLGLVPVVGIPLPMISYGRSSMLTSFILLGLIGNTFVNRNINLK